MKDLFKRYATSLSASVAITAGLLLVMTYAIDNDEISVIDPTPGATLSFLPEIEEKNIERTDRRPEPPKPVDKTPPVPELKFAVFSHNGDAIINPAPPPGPDVTVNGGYHADGDPLPIVTVAPEYPARAAQREIQGWVIVEFVIDAMGRVQTPRVVQAQPSGVFDRAALNAVKRYKYKPRVLNGEAIPVHGVRQRIVFNLT